MQNAIFRAFMAADKASVKHAETKQALVTAAVKDAASTDEPTKERGTLALIQAGASFGKIDFPQVRNDYLSEFRTRIKRACEEAGIPVHTVKRVKGVWGYVLATATKRRGKTDERAAIRKALALVVEAVKAGDAEVLATLADALKAQPEQTLAQAA